MEGRMKKYMQVSPERARVWTEKSPKYHYNQQQKVPLVYYLCRNRQLEHPHFMEVSLSSSEGLYLRDVINRLNALRGRGMASMYSWSCKRSYRNGFVWHDLCDDDLIVPAHGNEYVLKGSELFEESNSGNYSPTEPATLPNQKTRPEEPPYSRSHDSSSSSPISRNTKSTSNADESSPSDQHPISSDFPATKNSSRNSSLSPSEYKLNKNDGLSDAKTLVGTPNTRNRGVSTDDGLTDHENNINNNKTKNYNTRGKDTSEISRDSVLTQPSTSSASPSIDKMDTVKSRIRDDVKKLNRNLEVEEFRGMPSNVKLKASNMIIQLISCGSISVKDNGFGLVNSYKPRFSGSDCLADNPRLIGMKFEDKEYFSGSLVETSMIEEEVSNLKRSSSFNHDKSGDSFDFTTVNDDEERNPTRTKCIPRSIKASLSKNPRCESMRSSPLSGGPRISSDRAASSRTMTPGTSKRMTEPLNLSSNHNKNVIRIEESLLQELGL